MKMISRSVKQTEKIAVRLGEGLTGGETICLFGELGSGKTTFVQALGKSLGISKRIVSPTFIIVRHYQLDLKKLKNMYHLDLYRMKNSVEIWDLGLKEFMGKPTNLVIIEWPERINYAIEGKRINIYFRYVDEYTREIEIKKVYE